MILEFYRFMGRIGFNRIILLKMVPKYGIFYVVLRS